MEGLNLLERAVAEGPQDEIEKTVLANGLTVISDRMASVETVSLGVWVAVGTRHEVEAENGISHLLEHMAFKGTERRSARAIAEEIEAVGGHLNAYTGREVTAYYAKVLKENLDLGVDILADIVQHAVMDEEELARERAVILQEIGEANDTPGDIIFDYFQETAFPGQAVGRPVLGSARVVESVPRQAILDYMRHHYRPARMVLAASGKLDHAGLVALAEEAFRGMLPAAPPAPESARYQGGDFRSTRALEQVHIVIGLEGLCHTDPDYYAAQAFATLLGGGMSSRLFQEVREKRGLVYTISAFSSSFADSGIFGVYAGTGEAEVGEVVRIISAELARAGEEASEAEIERAAAQLKAGILMNLESPGMRAEQLAHNMQIFGRPIPTRETIHHIEAVDKAAIARVARRLLASRPTVAALGPLGQLEPYDSLAARLA